ncbi:MAG TPA: Hsp20/alpha crystallin family protein [Thermoplasmata archaeon]|nr:Hsp20/alpha crystallin family protein [Thermoplasmata archaeon]
MDRRSSKDKHLKDIVEKSQFWDVEDMMRNFDREMAQFEHGLGHMVWDMEEHRVTTRLRPLPITPSFQISEDDKEFKLVVRLPTVSKEDIRLNVDRNSVELFACTDEAVCRPYYISVDASGELVPESAEASLSKEVFEVKVAKAKKKRLKIE